MNHGPERITLAQFMQLGLQRVNLLHLLEEIVARYLFDAGDQFAIRQFQSVVRAGEAGLRYILYGELVGILLPRIYDHMHVRPISQPRTVGCCRGTPFSLIGATGTPKFALAR